MSLDLFTVSERVEQQSRRMWASGRRPIKVRIGLALQERIRMDAHRIHPGSHGADLMRLGGLEIEWVDGREVRVISEDDLPAIWDDDEVGA